jgi:amidase
MESVRALAARLARGEVSCRSVVIECLARLDDAAACGGVAWRDDDAVLAAADVLDRRFAAGGAVGPLHGIPVSVKDWIEVAGFPCAAGDPQHAGRRPHRDASVVARLRAAGAIVVAKTTTGPRTALHGVPRHPHAADRSPGYSSAGDAIVVTLGGSAVGLGSDSGGSIRFPAHCCGLVGMRPTFGRVPVTGHFPRIGPLADARTVIGPLARCVDDVRLVLPLLAGPDGRDPTCAPVPFTPERDVAGLRVAIHRASFDDVLDRDVAGALDRAAAALAAAGATVSEADVLDVRRALDITIRYWGRARLAAGEVETLLADWDRSRVAAMRILDRFDVVLSPAAPRAAPALDAGANDGDWTFLLSSSLWGWPAVVVPAGRDGDGLPLGVQLTSGPWQEPVLFASASAIEHALTGSR